MRGRSLAAFSFAISAVASPAAAANSIEISLPRAVAIALVANRNLAVSRLNLKSEEQGLEAAKSEFELKIVPTTTFGSISTNAFTTGGTGVNNSIGAQLTKKLESGTVVSFGPSWNRSGDVRNETLNVGIQQPLLRGFGSDVNLDGVRRAEFSIASADRGLEQARVNTALEVIGAYYEAIKQERLAALNDALAARLRRHALIARGKEGVGLASSLDTYRAEIRLKDAEDAANQAHNAHDAARNQLKLILNMSLETDLRLARPPQPRLAVPDVEMEAVRQRAELVQLRAEIEEAKRALQVAGNALLPDVSVRWYYGQVAGIQPAFAQVLPTTQRQSAVYLQLSSDLYHTAEKANYRRAKLKVDTLELTLKTRSADIRRQVRRQLALLEEAKRRVVLRREQIRQAEGKLALAEVKFTYDMADNFAVIEAEGELQSARSNLVATQADLAVGVYNLDAMAGHLLDSFPDREPGGID
jgi:outer membrane protein